MTPRRRVVVTGLGPVSCIGVGRDAFGKAILSGRSGQRPITSFDTTGFDHADACEIADFDPREWCEHVDPHSIGRAAGFAVAAAGLALADARLTPEDLRRQRVPIAVGTCDGEAAELDDLTARTMAGFNTVGIEEARRYSPVQLPLSIARDLRLASIEPVPIGTACAAGNYAIGYAFDAIRCGDADVALCGGAEALSRKLFSGFYRVGTIAADACRPFDAHRSGILTGEGAGILVLEDLEHARARDATVHAEVIGFGVGCDARHPVAPDSDSVAACIRLAHDDAGIEAGDVDLISAHGTGTPVNDVTEVAAIRQVFGDRPPPTISIKSMIGHAMGAASAIAAIAAIIALEARFLPPTINHIRTDPQCPIDCVPNVGRPAPLDIVQNNGLAFGGNNAVLLLRRPSSREEAPA
ncbi:beta-ketoacyl-[acyl-carrier-protein] synthase family protein [Phytomonospora sp. NPDC050363]|uniref:beta-ketoacyl-[acyl-carrier-protein] synthase family protein n=1 Tax=Phytomonospora sp. NPDC050363 TaxID=3155642 RepID=UPI00340804DF